MCRGRRRADQDCIGAETRADPPSLGFSVANPEIDFNNSPVYVNDRLRDWPTGGSGFPRRGRVSSFGFGGTNCHVVLEEAAPRAVGAIADHAEQEPFLLPLSTREADALLELRGRYAEFLQSETVPPAAMVCRTASLSRRHEAHRAALVGHTCEDFLAALGGWARDGRHHALAGPSEAAERGRRAFLFTGQGAVYPGMGRALFETEPTFRTAVEQCDAVLRAYLDRPVSDLLRAAPDDAAAGALLRQGQYGQPSLFALEFALAELWRSWGVTPDFVMGHSLGEYVAAAVAGALPVEDALHLVARRGALMQLLQPAGRMAAVFARSDRLEQLLRGSQGLIEIAALNGPANFTIAGPGAALDKVLAACADAGVAAEPLETSHAFHSALLEPMLADLEAEAAALRLRNATIPLISTLTGAAMAPGAHDAAHWRRHSREPVQFQRALETLLAEGCRDFLELGPHPVLCGLGKAVAAESGAPDCRWLPSLNRGQGEREVMLRSLSQLYVRGVSVNWQALYRSDAKPHRVSLPVTPVHGKCFWLETRGTGPAQQVMKQAMASTLGLLGGEHPRPRSRPNMRISWGSRATLTWPITQSEPGAIFPATAYLDMAITAARRCLASMPVALRDVRISQPLMLNGDGESAERHVQTLVRRDVDSRRMPHRGAQPVPRRPRFGPMDNPRPRRCGYLRWPRPARRA